MRFTIIKGPSKFDLMTSLFSGKVPQTISFMVSEFSHPVEVTVFGIFRDMTNPNRYYIAGRTMVGNEHRLFDQHSCTYEVDDPHGTYSGFLEV